MHDDVGHAVHVARLAALLLVVVAVSVAGDARQLRRRRIRPAAAGVLGVQGARPETRYLSAQFDLSIIELSSWETTLVMVSLAAPQQ